MNSPIRLAFVSDVACPWCAIGLAGLERAIERLGDELRIELTQRLRRDDLIEPLLRDQPCAHPEQRNVGAPRQSPRLLERRLLRPG